ncbi:ABC transporter substrate-binding protein [Salipaludibacillus sp. CF4.18]|uniref:ABC transporter substrate-binding protein n=1 Tax=Salipaludibacillus sp. CF4.18 TaxID=3373081 RepID=UPI003EE81B37
MNKTKQLFLLVMLVIVVSMMVACGNDAAEENETGNDGTAELEATDEVTIGVYGGNWEEDIRDIALDEFEEETGIEVNVVAGADAEWYSQIRASNGNDPIYDVLILQPDTIERAMVSDLLAPLASEHVPNIADIAPSINERFTNEGEVYGAGFSMGQLGIAYRRDLVETPPESWLDLWDEQYKGSLGISSPTYSAGLQFFSGIVHALGGEESNPEDIDRTFEKLAELKENTVAYPDNPGSIQTLLERGEIVAVPFWDGRVFGLEEAGLDVGFTYPEEGPVAALASWVVTKGSPNLANAYELVDYLSSPEVQGEFAERSFYGMANLNVEYSEKLEERIQVGEEFYQELKWVDYETVTPKLSEITNRWTETFGGE